ncbi:AAA family ATPase [Anaerorhabdus furcosa]|uniref:AAA domain-containing protein n=1 Tax=Anaerorhabdus furcosa TaxID=118967 RepID=A0A1T4PCC6_9FIRM|nr:AAA family ATPase [Anaerorhabdus furcosa]SJZ89031.1 AAA domain-containing protein [Anaerorhabdus furcosa]
MVIIHLFGASGSGTTTLGKFIAKKLNYFFMDTDDYYWLPTKIPYTDARKVEERLNLMKLDMNEKQGIVLSGSLCGWGDSLIPKFSLAVYLNTRTEIRIERLIQRERISFGSRIDEDGDMHENHKNFIEWARCYDTAGINCRGKLLHDIWIEKLECPCLFLNGENSLENNANQIIEMLKN